MYQIIATTGITKNSIAKITGYYSYGDNDPCFNIPMPINILRNRKFFDCRSFKQFKKFINHSPSKWETDIEIIRNKKIRNKNIIIAGFTPFRDYNELINHNNFPILEYAENIFFVECSSNFIENIISKLKIYNKLNPNIYIIDIGFFNYFDRVTKKITLSNIKLPLYVGDKDQNEWFFTSTKKVVNLINNEFCVEEKILLKE